MQVGIDSFVSLTTGLHDPASVALRVEQLLEEIELADQVGLDVFAIGEHHRPEYVASSPVILLAAAAARTSNIRLSSAVTVLSSDDPIRVFQDFATLDLISKGRAEIIVGRGSFIESFPLFGLDLSQYDQLFAEKLDLLLHVRDQEFAVWSGQLRSPLTGQGVYPRPLQSKLPIRLGVGGTMASFTRAGDLGLPLTVAMIGGDPSRFRPHLNEYRRSWIAAGNDPNAIDIAVHTHGFVAETDEEAAETYYPSYDDTFTRIGQERGWPPQDRSQYDMGRGPRGSLMIGSPKTVAERMRALDATLGGISRITMLNDASLVPHELRLNSIRLLGSQVKALLNS